MITSNIPDTTRSFLELESHDHGAWTIKRRRSPTSKRKKQERRGRVSRKRRYQMRWQELCHGDSEGSLSGWNILSNAIVGTGGVRGVSTSVSLPERCTPTLYEQTHDNPISNGLATSPPISRSVRYTGKTSHNKQ